MGHGKMSTGELWAAACANDRDLAEGAARRVLGTAAPEWPRLTAGQRRDLRAALVDHAVRCESCGDRCDPDEGRRVLEELYPEGGAPILCEGCAEDELDAVRSADADARELGLDWSDEYGE